MARLQAFVKKDNLLNVVRHDDEQETQLGFPCMTLDESKYYLQTIFMMATR